MDGRSPQRELVDQIDARSPRLPPSRDRSGSSRCEGSRIRSCQRHPASAPTAMTPLHSRQPPERGAWTFLTHLERAREILPAPFGRMRLPHSGMMGPLLGWCRMLANMTDPSKLVPFMGRGPVRRYTAPVVAPCGASARTTSSTYKQADEEINRTLIYRRRPHDREAKSRRGATKCAPPI